MKYKYNNQWIDINIKALDSMPIGSIIAFAGTTIPNGWLECNGSAVSRTTYADLFGTIGTSHGNGNGTTTFNIPNLKGKTIFGLNTNDLDFEAIGNDGGAKTVALTIDEMPSHSHPFNTFASRGTAQGGTAISVVNNWGENPIGNTGGGQAHNNMPPYIVEKYIIKAFNVVPTMAGIVNADSTSSTNGYSCSYINGKLAKGNCNINTYNSADQTSTGQTRKVLSSSTSSITTHGGKVLIIANGVCYNTGAGYFLNIGVQIGSTYNVVCQSNQTTASTITGSKIVEIPAGTYETKMYVASTDNSGAIKVPAFSGYGYSIIEL